MIYMLELGVNVIHNITGQKGVLVMMIFDRDYNKHYLFQPRALNPETGAPVDTILVSKSEIDGGVDIETPFIPIEAFGNVLEDLGTGYRGKPRRFVVHETGCVHVVLQSSKIIKSTGRIADECEVNILRVKGKGIPVKTKIEQKAEEAVNPSPVAHASFRHLLRV